MGHILLRMRVCKAIGFLTCLFAGCAPAVSTGSFDAPDPASKIYAIENAVRAGDRSATAYIVEQLESDDPAVRLVAISALQRLTGETHGYRSYASDDERRDAVARWVEAVKQEEHMNASTEDAAAHGE